MHRYYSSYYSTHVKYSTHGTIATHVGTIVATIVVRRYYTQATIHRASPSDAWANMAQQQHLQKPETNPYPHPHQVWRRDFLLPLLEEGAAEAAAVAVEELSVITDFNEFNPYFELP